MERHYIPESTLGVAGVVDQVIDGDEVLITRDGTAVAQVVKLAESKPSVEMRIGSLEWLIAQSAGMTPLKTSSVELLRQVYEEND